MALLWLSKKTRSSFISLIYFISLQQEINCYIFKLLEIKSYGLGSRIRDMEAEWRLRVITDEISCESLVGRTGTEG